MRQSTSRYAAFHNAALIAALCACPSARLMGQQLQSAALAFDGRLTTSESKPLRLLGDTRQPQPSSSSNEGAQMLGGTLASIALGLVAYAVTGGPKSLEGDNLITPNKNTAFAIGSFVGSATAVQLIGRRDGSRSPLWRSTLGAGTMAAPLLLGRKQLFLPVLGVLLSAPAQAFAASVGYTSGRTPPAR